MQPHIIHKSTWSYYIPSRGLKHNKGSLHENISYNQILVMNHIIIIEKKQYQRL